LACPRRDASVGTPFLLSCPLLLTVSNLHKTYRRGRLSLHALNGVNLSLAPATRLALVGSSASGKSTLAKCIAGWETPDTGDIRIAPDARVQLIPQHAGDSLNPYFCAAGIVEEPLRIRGNRAPAKARGWLQRVGLPPNRDNDRPVTFSGGERVRLAVARALAASDSSPTLLIFDESFSSLDAPLQDQLLDLLRDLQAEFPLTYLLIAHDLRFAARFAARPTDAIAVMDAGRIAERGLASDVVQRPQSEAGRQLVAAFL
jgi:peptide/nickel transport system ATP-binding protein